MHFAKWMRKNTKKIMVFVVIFSMVSFVVGYTGLQLFFSLFGGDTQVIGTYDGGKIRVREFRNAQNELRLLRMLGADRLLLAQGGQGLAGPLMAYLLFPDSREVAEIELPAGLKQAAQSGQIPVSLDAIETFFAERPQPEITWLLLRAEAAGAGCAVSDEMARQLLGQILPQLFQGFESGHMINTIIAQTRVTEDQLVRTFADLLGVMFYTGNITDNQTVTLGQIQATVGRSRERVDAEFVRIPAEWFIDPDSPVEADKMQRQFETYRTVLPGTATDDNPFGFGYKLPKRVQLEYMAVLLDDVRTQIERPTAEAMEDFYSRNIERFRYPEPVDPDDPDGEKVTKTRTFAESLPQIRSYLEQERITRLANQIFNDARTAIERGLLTLNVEEAGLEQLKEAAGDYLNTATELSARYNVSILTGKTGSLSAADVGRDDILRELRLQQGGTAVPLAEVVFAAQLDPHDVRRQIGVPIVRPWENIGPMSGGYYDETAGRYHRLMTMMRIVGMEESTIPERMNISYSVRPMVILPAQTRDEHETTFSLAEQVANDIRLLRAMETARTRARQLASLVEEHGWDDGIAAFNAEYKDEGIPGANLETVHQQARMSKAEIDRMLRFMAANPAGAEFIQTRLKTGALNEKLYALLPNGEPATGTIFKTLDVEKARASCVVKSVTRLPVTEADYLDNKAMTALQLNTSDSADLALLHLKPKNLLARMNYAADQMPIIDGDEPVLPPPGGGF